VFPAPERFAAAMRGLFKPTDHKRRRIGGSPARHAGVVNGSPAMIAVIGDRVMSVLVLETRDGRIAHACGVSAPARLGRISATWARREHDAPLHRGLVTRRAAGSGGTVRRHGQDAATSARQASSSQSAR